jgi:hypothetical protein
MFPYTKHLNFCTRSLQPHPAFEPPASVSRKLRNTGFRQDAPVFIPLLATSLLSGLVGTVEIRTSFADFHGFHKPHQEAPFLIRSLVLSFGCLSLLGLVGTLNKSKTGTRLLKLPL